MQVLSQLSYNPTDSVGPLVSAVSVATRLGSSPGCSTGEFRAPRFTGFHCPGSLVNEARRVLIPRQRFDFEDSTGVRSLSIERGVGAPLPPVTGVRCLLDMSRIFTI